MGAPKQFRKELWSDNGTPSFKKYVANLQKNSIRWAVGLGRYAPEKVSGAPKGLLTRVRNSL